MDTDFQIVLNVVATLAGPTGIFNLGSGAAETFEDKNVMTIGADERGQHSFMASDAVKVTVSLFKTSPVNSQLQAAYDAQSITSALWGQNVITVTDIARGDVSILPAVAFKKKPTLTYAKEAGIIEWEFDVISVNSILGL